MSKRHRDLIQKQFAKTVEAFSKSALRDTPEVLAEKVQFARPQAADVALDVACGPGSLVLALAPRVRFARGIDITREMLRQAREFQREGNIVNACFDLGEAEHLPYPAAAFDLVTCQCSLHHLVKPEQAVWEMARVMRPEGRLVIIDTMGPESDAKFELHNRIERLRDPSHTSSLRWTTFRRLFDEAGLRVLDERVRRRERSFRLWMVRAGLNPEDRRYREVEGLMAESLEGDGAAFSPSAQDGDYRIVHHEGMFLLGLKAAPSPRP